MLSHYRVLDLTDHRTQLAGHILRGLGAEVILIEPPEGSPARHIGPFAGDQVDIEGSLPFWAHNRGKKSVVLDLDTAPGRAHLHELVRSADVLIENEPVGDGSRARGLDRQTLAALNPALVHVSVTPFGQSGPKAGWASSDLTLLAASGALALTGDRDRAPLLIAPAPQAWLHAAAEAAQASLIALYERDHHSGVGQHADISVQQSAGQIAASQMLTTALNASMTRRYAGGVLYGGLDIKLMWACADGHVSVTFLFGAAIGPFSRRLMEWVYEEGGCDEATRDKDWIDYTMMLLDGREPISEYERLRDHVLVDFFATRTKAELLEQAVARRLLIAPVNSIADVAASVQLASRDYWEKVDQGPLGHVTFPGAIARPARTPLEVLPRAPHLGQHTDSVLAKVVADVAADLVAVAPSSTQPPVAVAGPRTGGAMAGLKVLDLMWVMAGPAASRVLADYGAEVIRVESMHRIDTARTLAPFVNNEGHPEKSGLFNNLNGNKRGLALDLSSPDSHDVMLDLVRWADVVLDAFSPHGMGSLGLAHDDLLALKPELVVASTCLSGQTGPLSSLAGFGTMAAAMSGFFHICGWPDRPPSGPFGAYTDYVAPRYFLCSVLAAVAHRDRTGQGQYVDFSQAEASMHNLSWLLLDYSVNGRVAQRQGNDHPRFAPHGVYPCAGEDAWVAVACETDEQWLALCAELGHAAEPVVGLAVADRLARRRELDELISAWTAPRTPEQVTEALQARAVPAHGVANSPEALADPQLAHRNHFVEVPHGNLGTTWMEGSRFVLSRTPATIHRAGPTMGEDSFDILAGTLGYDTDRIADLAAQAILE